MPSKLQFNKLPKEDDHWGLPSNIYRNCRSTIDQAITAFNEAATNDDKKIALEKMQAAMNAVDLRLPPSVLTKANGFHQMKKDLFPQLKAAYAEMGIHTMLKAGKADSAAARIVSDMSPEKADRLMEILHKGATRELKKDLKNLYATNDKSSEAVQWRNFLSNHTIEFLGGGNSKNFKVTHMLDGSIKILKVDNRLNMPRHVEQHLRNELGDVFTPIDADRQVRGLDPNNGTIASRTLLVTDYCTSGSVDEHAKSLGKTDKYSGASHVMGQMTQVFMDIQKANCCFPDAKLTNWLVDSNKKVRLADTKSFLFTKNGEYSTGIRENEGTGLLSTPGFEPTEMDSDTFNAEKLHASLLGRNIYAYLTEKWPKPINLNHSIFNGQIGQEYKKLISDLIVDPPANRMSLQEAQTKLMELGIKADPVQKTVFNKSKTLGDALKMDLSPMLNSLIKSEMGNGVSDRAAIASKIHKALDEVKAISESCDQLIKKISGSKIADKSTLESAKQNAIRDAVSLEDLKGKLEGFEQNLKQNLIKAPETHQSTQPTRKDLSFQYNRLKRELDSLRFGESDIQMERYLSRCDKAIMKNRKPDDVLMAIQIEKMKTVIAGLKSPENTEVRAIIDKLNQQSRFYTIGMQKKALSIDEAMANVPIEERAQFLSSNHSTVSEALKAIASHRKSPTEILNEKGQINVKKTAQAFKAFKEKFKEQMAKRTDIQPEEEKPAPRMR